MKTSFPIEICASSFKWSSGHGVANCSDLGHKLYGLSSILLKSPKTGKVIKFELNQEEAIQYEMWDGEFLILRSPDKKHAIQIWNC
jgi:hypothetical protein